MPGDASKPNQTSTIFTRLPVRQQPRVRFTAVKLSAESTRLDGINSHPQDSHVPCHTRQRTDDMDQHGHQETPGGHQGPYAGHSRSPASQEDEMDQAQRDAQSMSNDIRELVAGIRDLSSTLIQNNNRSMNTTLNNSNRIHQLSI